VTERALNDRQIARRRYTPEEFALIEMVVSTFVKAKSADELLAFIGEVIQEYRKGLHDEH
jgi:hypothetical protein